MLSKHTRYLLSIKLFSSSVSVANEYSGKLCPSYKLPVIRATHFNQGYQRWMGVAHDKDRFENVLASHYGDPSLKVKFLFLSQYNLISPFRS